MHFLRAFYSKSELPLIYKAAISQQWARIIIPSTENLFWSKDEYKCESRSADVSCLQKYRLILGLCLLFLDFWVNAIGLFFAFNKMPSYYVRGWPPLFRRTQLNLALFVQARVGVGATKARAKKSKQVDRN